MIKLFFIFLLTPTAHAAETTMTVDLPTVHVNADSTFDTLSDESYAPKKIYNFENDRPGTVDSVIKSLPYTAKSYAGAAGGLSVNLNGRTADDTQVYTLGVPLNLAQGGGADLSIFPSYLWSGALISPSVSLSGFSPQATSGSMELKLYTREWMRREFKHDEDLHARLTTTYDRTLQTYSLGSRTENVAVVLGMSQGGLEGPAGSLTYSLLKSREHALSFHFLGSSQEGLLGYSTQYAPTPNLRKKYWRVIPVLESHQEFDLGTDSPLIVESTVYGDLQSLVLADPNPINASESRTQQYGFENVILNGPYTLALSGRYVRYYQVNYGSIVEWPMMGTVARDFEFTQNWNLKILGGAEYVAHPGTEYQARISVKKTETAKQYFFGELSSTPKIPTLLSRYYSSNFFTPNPNLKVERVYTALGGYQADLGNAQSTTTLKTEYRTDTQVNYTAPYPSTMSTTVNAGTASLVSLNEDLTYRLSPNWNLEENTLLTYSRLNDTGLPYPDIPYVSQQARIEFIPNDQLHVSLNGRYLGPSKTYSGQFHAPYFLGDSWVSYLPTREIEITAGVDNLFDKKAESVIGYPLPGRIFYASGKVLF
jgi:hypothetical protein